jgi:osmotically-inducible protein OsmY
LEAMSEEESYPSASGSAVTADSSGHLSSQFDFEMEDQRNWRGQIDEKIKLTVLTALHWDLAVPRDRVRVNVSRGWVTLTGRVTREYEKQRAEADARMTAGVAGLTNRLTYEVES